MTTVTLSSKGQLSIPKKVREELHLQAGQKFMLITRGETITLVPERSLEWARGLLKGSNPGDYRDHSDRLDRLDRLDRK